MKSEIDKFSTIIRDFAQLPKKEISPTFMEICKYPYNRFEEICSRVLQFYFNPKAEHGFKALWLVSLLDAIKQTQVYQITDNVNVVTEENANGKRIDLTIISDKFVIGIENKTTADVYNPLNEYTRHIQDAYKDKIQILLVLSIKPITCISAKRTLKVNGFISLTYKELFESVYQNLGNYITNSNQKYLTYMLDFMKTIDNMDNSNTNIENDFFFKNKEEIEELIGRFNRYKENILSYQKEQISILEQRISDVTGRKWWVWQGWDLGISFNDEEHRIGIESSYEATKDDPCAKFHIYITTWKMKDWFPYKDNVLKHFPEYIFLDEYNDGRSYLHLPIIEGNDQDKIIEALKKTFETMKMITSKE
ncbi:PD-(D/E)XK nuclease family protein [Parabacteroides timonensis]|uniref:PD-(D/E)XK nuclease family protein n=1 Tax=Parabacteroides timonensis TaxID=1871013 RepID=UPI00094ED6C1|nr:PD-(D/E)XK nuclease family protein [Parabacteroides timonensis]